MNEKGKIKNSGVIIGVVIFCVWMILFSFFPIETVVFSIGLLIMTKPKKKKQAESYKRHRMSFLMWSD